MSSLKGNGMVTSLPQPEPKLPPELYGRRRELAKVQLVEREIGFLEEELKSIEGLQLASRSCKEYGVLVVQGCRFCDGKCRSSHALNQENPQILPVPGTALWRIIVFEGQIAVNAMYAILAGCPSVVFSRVVIANAVTHTSAESTFAAAARHQIALLA
ncbi:hypothetical protein STAS_28424 [Striga asiatica]|uniref:Uncharacterized protein n=1 Tax=Striga asiatica TaxID=4170 RepID=A0A5A7R141_STRAF|nr:hypothetical protein STAS_28424 [Striga asiatica]